MPIGTATAAGVVGSSVAGATTPGTISCAVTGAVTFASPGLSAAGAITKKTTMTTLSSTTASGTGYPNTATALGIVSTTTPCPQTGGVPDSTDPSSCLASTTKKGIVTYDIVKDPYYYDTTGSYASSGLADLTAALEAKPIKAVVNSIKVDLVFGSAAEVYPTALGGSGLCGTSDVGFDITGNVQAGVNTVATYDELVCLPVTPGRAPRGTSSPT